MENMFSYILHTSTGKVENSMPDLMSRSIKEVLLKATPGVYTPPLKWKVNMLVI